jgi:histidinol-phosphate aminotransferase
VSAELAARVPGPSPAALAAIHGFQDAGAAPDPDAGPLRQAIADHFDIPVDAVCVGAGTAALLHAVIARQAPRGGEVICSAPSWPPYARLTAQYRMRPQLVPLAGYGHDLPAIAAAAGPETRLVMLDSPHSVTGTTVALREVRALADALPEGAAVVYDNVYGEYQDNDVTAEIRDTVSSAEWVLICRTFSKAHRLFGLRVGYLLAHPTVLAAVGPIVQRYDVNQVGQVAALASLNDPAHLAGNRALVRRNRRLITATLVDGGVPCAPGQGHSVLFVLAGIDPRRQLTLDRAAALLRAAGASVRTPADHGIAGHLQLRVDDLPTEVLWDAVTRMLEHP